MKPAIIHTRASVTYLMLVVWCLVVPATHAGADSWHALQQRYREKTVSHTPVKHPPAPDPWACLKAVYLPFTKDLEHAALTDRKSAKQVFAYLRSALLPYDDFIQEASRIFGIPPEIIGAMIMVESGGDARARAETSTAKGLMQTIDGTFRHAHKDLSARGIMIMDDPFDPHGSIMAGAWYLDKMYALAATTHTKTVLDRQNIPSWRYPLQYYYAGPHNGQKAKELVVVYAGGRRVIINKASYSRKVLRWAQILSEKG
jgi:soluble lytic murein transglycosylase-like protein